MAETAPPTLAERLLATLPAGQLLAEADTPMIGELMSGRGANWTWSTSNGVLLGIEIAGEPARTVADLRRILSALPEPTPDKTSAETAAMLIDAIEKRVMMLMRPVLEHLVMTRAQFGSLLRLLEQQGVIDHAEYARRWYTLFERDFGARMELLEVRSPEDDAAFRERQRAWIEQVEGADREFIGAELYETLTREHREMIDRMQAVGAPAAAEAQESSEGI